MERDAMLHALRLQLTAHLLSESWETRNDGLNGLQALETVVLYFRRIEEREEPRDTSGDPPEAA